MGDLGEKERKESVRRKATALYLRLLLGHGCTYLAHAAAP